MFILLDASGRPHPPVAMTGDGVVELPVFAIRPRVFIIKNNKKEASITTPMIANGHLFT
jgi:hypothetical protein